MSLGIAFKCPEGIVLAADSRVTLTSEIVHGTEKVVLSSTFDNATKLLRIPGHNYVGAITYGLGALGQQEPRTPHSFLPEFENELGKGTKRVSVLDYAQKFSSFFHKQWAIAMPQDYVGPDLVFLVGGFDEDQPYGTVYLIQIPSNPTPSEQHAGQFGITWGGQMENTARLVKGFDPMLPTMIKDRLGLSDQQTAELTTYLEGKLVLPVPYQFLPLQDCVDLSIFLIRTTIEIQTWMVGVRGVGGAIDVATITRTEGFQPIQVKAIVGRRDAS